MMEPNEYRRILTAFLQQYYSECYNVKLKDPSRIWARKLRKSDIKKVEVGELVMNQPTFEHTVKGYLEYSVGSGLNKFYKNKKYLARITTLDGVVQKISFYQDNLIECTKYFDKMKKEMEEKNPVRWSEPKKITRREEPQQKELSIVIQNPTNSTREYNGKVSREYAGKTSLEKTIIRWYIDSAPKGTQVYWRVISSIPEEVKNTNEQWLGTAPYEDTRSFNILGLTYENSRDIQIEITIKKKGYVDQKKRFNVNSAIDQTEISAFFDLVEDDEDDVPILNRLHY